ncbi:ATP-binding response regulator [Niveibacterium microcysteis]|uniref:histidine kinase n=1 Tax=Niveibacterium microcysteis TaxID=2811415 RepID=A0ABX7M608_9RHOO|nr:ATP-binding protein [Niveibacterium microcysteis]QSI77175.1 response regulator [Niveibacterium microcysteis]
MTQGEHDKPLVLLVDDQPANLHVLAATLKHHYRIKTATSGRMALELARLADRPQLILLDVMMPELSGFDVLRQLRDGAETRDVAVIVITADTSEASQLEGLELGADDFLTKPVSPGLLLARVRSLLRRKTAEVRFRQVVELMPSALLIVDQQRRIRFANGMVQALLGYAPAALVGELVDVLIPQDQVVQHRERVTEYFGAARPRRMAQGRALEALRRDGSTFPCEIGLSPIPGDDGTSVLVSIFDTSERRQTEGRLRQINSELEQQVMQAEKLASLGRLVANFAHDIGNPIGNVTALATSLTGRIRAVREDLKTGGLRRSELDAFLDTSEAATTMLASNLGRACELLESFKRMALDQATSQRREIDLAQWVDEFRYTLTPMLAEGKHRFMLDLPAGLRLHTSPGPLGQVIANLVSNAVAHAFEARSGGTIRISASRLPSGAIELCVSDDGVGMPPALLGQIFEPFFTTKAGRGGTGLGLDIVRSIVEKTLGGQISVRSEPGTGSSFAVTLPSAVDTP